MQTHNTLHALFYLAQTTAYTPNGLILSNIVAEKESQEYGACSFELNNKKIQFRVAKITPTKIGQFVTIWKRIGTGPTMPFDSQDQVDLFIISVRDKDHFGQFIFPKDVLIKQGAVSKNGVGGKRGMRVYPPWDITDNKQAQKTQEWQLAYFVEIEPTLDTKKILELLG
jgi:hypothetical protein